LRKATSLPGPDERVILRKGGKNGRTSKRLGLEKKKECTGGGGSR